jgi:hypothetical protein
MRFIFVIFFVTVPTPSFRPPTRLCLFLVNRSSDPNRHRSNPLANLYSFNQEHLPCDEMEASIQGDSRGPGLGATEKVACQMVGSSSIPSCGS